MVILIYFSFAPLVPEKLSERKENLKENNMLC